MGRARARRADRVHRMDPGRTPTPPPLSGPARRQAGARGRPRAAQLMSVTIDTGGRSITVSRPDKALFPCGITKLDLARHYDAVAPTMLRHLADRPLTLERYPDGIEAQR